MPSTILKAAGINGQLVLDGVTLRIERAGVGAFMTQGLKGNKEIPIRRITAVQFRRPNFFANGYLQISFEGGTEAKAGVFEAVKDENTVVFTKAQLLPFETIRDELSRRMAAQNAG